MRKVIVNNDLKASQYRAAQAESESFRLVEKVEKGRMKNDFPIGSKVILIYNLV